MRRMATPYSRTAETTYTEDPQARIATKKTRASPNIRILHDTHGVRETTLTAPAYHTP